MDKIAEDLEDAARRHNSKILYWHVNKLRGSSQSGIGPVKDRNGATIRDKERTKERWAEHFENLLDRDRVAGKDIEENKKVCDGKIGCEGRFVLRGRINDSTKRTKK
jgi:hypothetical protein